MKNLFYIVIGAALFFSETLSAQDTIQTTTRTETVTALKENEPARKAEVDYRPGIFGVRYMPTFSTVKFENSGGGIVEGDVVMSQGFSALLGVNFNNHVGLQAEIIYTRLLQKYKDANLNQQVNIDYVNIPLLLSLNTNRMRMVNLNVVVGPQLGINVGSKLTTTGTANGSTVTHAVLAVKKNDFGIAYGAGIDFGLNPAHTIRLDIGFRGVMGLLDIGDTNAPLETDSYYILKKDKMRTYAGYAGFTFLF